MGTWRRLAILAFSFLPTAAAAEALLEPDAAAYIRALPMEASRQPAEKWRAALLRMEEDRLRVERCLEDRPCRDIFAKPMADLVRRFSGLTGRELFAAVNRHYNGFPYQADRAAGGSSDRWASPLVFLQRSGDCEDFALAKYLTLRMLGVSETAMAVLLLRDRSNGRDHAVLLVRDGARGIVLDNLRELATLDDYGGYRPLMVLTAESRRSQKASRQAPAAPIPSSGAAERPPHAAR
jgi:predicted transglutaminase-like cysteine proteinase